MSRRHAPTRQEALLRVSLREYSERVSRLCRSAARGEIAPERCATEIERLTEILRAAQRALGQTREAMNRA